MNAVILSALLSAAMWTSPQAFAFEFKRVVAFGDSLTDNGNLYRATKRKTPAKRNYRGRFSNGPVWVEHMGSQLRMPVRVEAYGGAQSGYGGTINKSRGMRAQVDSYLARRPKGIDKLAVYMIWIGANDIQHIANGSSQSKASRTAAKNVKLAVKRLAAAGGRYFAVINLPDLGATPFGRKGNSASRSTLSRFSRNFNRNLRSALRGLGVKVKIVDAYTLFRKVQAAPKRYGLSDAVRSCLAVRCKNPGKFLFWDDRHPTTKGHRLVANHVISKL